MSIPSPLTHTRSRHQSGFQTSTPVNKSNAQLSLRESAAAINNSCFSTTKSLVTFPLASPAMGHWGTFPLTSNCLIFLVTSELHKLWHSTPCGWVKNIQAYSFVAVHCINFIVFSVSPFNYFLLVSCPSLHEILAMPLCLSNIWNRDWKINVHDNNINQPSVS